MPKKTSSGTLQAMSAGNPNGFKGLPPSISDTDDDHGSPVMSELGLPGLPQSEVNKLLGVPEKPLPMLSDRLASLPTAKEILAANKLAVETRQAAVEATKDGPPITPIKTITQVYQEQRDKVKGITSRHRVTVMKDHTLMYPDLFLSVFIAGPRFEQIAFAEMFARARCRKADKIEDADLVVFVGGADVDPQLYGADKHPSTSFDVKVDDRDIKTYVYCLDNGVPMFGVCRGAQFLHVMNGGKLYQHVDGHNGDHTMWDVHGKKKIDRVSSVHHQMVIPQTGNDFRLLAVSQGISTERWKDDKICDRGQRPDVEAFFYRETCCIGVQGHPEYSGYPYFTKWCLDQINDLVMLNPDIGWDSTVRRMKADLIQQRKVRLKKQIVLIDKGN